LPTDPEGAAAAAERAVRTVEQIRHARQALAAFDVSLADMIVSLRAMAEALERIEKDE